MTGPEQVFDATAVPPFPVVRLTMSPDGTVTIDGRPVHPAPGQDATDAGVDAVAALARDLQLHAVRVRATVPGGSHDMVVTDRGQTHPLEPQAPTPSGNPRARRRALVAASGALAVVLAAGATGTVAAARGGGLVGQDSPQVVEYVPPGRGANLPVVAPAGFAQRAAWAVQVDDWSTPVLLNDGRVAVHDAEGSLYVLDAEGRTVWQGGAYRGPVHTGAVEGRPVLMGHAGAALSLWALDAPDADPVEIALPSTAQAEVDLSGSVPLVRLPNQTVEVLGAGGLVRRDVPVGARAVAATPDGVVAASERSWWLIPATGDIQRNALPRPAGATGAWLRLMPADDRHLVGLWPAGEQVVVAVVDLEHGQITAAATLSSRAGTSFDEPVRDPRHPVLTLGSVYVDYSGGGARVIDLGDVQVAAVSGTEVFGVDTDRTPVLVDVTSNTPAVTRYAQPGAQTGRLVGVSGDLAFVMTQKVEATFLYALPRTSDSTAAEVHP